jgi:hypothetical protein
MHLAIRNLTEFLEGTRELVAIGPNQKSIAIAIHRQLGLIGLSPGYEPINRA